MPIKKEKKVQTRKFLLAIVYVRVEKQFFGKGKVCSASRRGDRGIHNSYM